MGHDAELETFKTRIDLRQYAAIQVYAWDRRDSWRGSTVIRRGADKSIIKLNTNGGKKAENDEQRQCSCPSFSALSP
jgi:hypothetical protein